MIRKNENFGISQIREGSLSQKCGSVEYKMSNALAQHILKIHKGPKKSKQEILCHYVNSEMGLKGHCARVLVDLD